MRFGVFHRILWLLMCTNALVVYCVSQSENDCHDTGGLVSSSASLFRKSAFPGLAGWL
ncbi:hypothetical protein SAMN05216228_10636 [Rhizobium tibeticum]|uniref:Uncharacterized protein n=1 Tax=Rhizobium tibeticum TaxID=501024 RepID=A0A1H8WEY5_9HYPH|nr:hypothetical protein RTCCBAU85039_6500 [Rhizobium tibeticum]SEP26191.1 hypothetical protein SAMN05216228_10636 [Rhizobium tibeticum]